jgi:MinD superfamily P-loop ATPase
MRIAIASGKGGTGKTTVATNLAYVAALSGRTTACLDCDVEEPNGHIFLKPQIAEEQPVWKTVPRVDETLCTHCGTCGDVCQYSAIVCIGRKVLVYPELCHACGGCAMLCPAHAIREASRQVGTLRLGYSGSIHCIDGLLNVGEAMSPPVIRAVRQAAPPSDLVIVDAPPGTSCPVIASIRGCDYVVLVTEPTPFGLNDLQLAVAMVRELAMPFGVVVNRAGSGDDRVQTWCLKEAICLLAEIPDDRSVAEAYSRGQMACEALPHWGETFRALLDRVQQAVTV